MHVKIRCEELKIYRSRFSTSHLKKLNTRKKEECKFRLKRDI